MNKNKNVILLDAFIYFIMFSFFSEIFGALSKEV